MNPPDWITHLWHLAVAFILAIPIGWNREKEDRSAGIRTIPLVSIASCAYMLAAMSMFKEGEALARVTTGIITGIGFIGGGAIIYSSIDRIVLGTATAASIWCTGAIGVAVAWDRFDIATTVSLVTFLSLYTKKVVTGPSSDATDQPATGKPETD